jgi:hypothetical protein
MKSENILFLFMGLAISVYGVKAIFRQEYDSWRFGHVDLGDYHHLIGFALLAFGGFIVYSVFRKK